MAAISQQHSEDDNQLYRSELPEGYIRLIRLLPPEHTPGIIKCLLFSTPLIPAPNYEALSYVWGSANNKSDESTILINGIATPIRKNLWDCLFHIRGRGERVLWIDAICINQENVLERNCQVPQMKGIYESAARVVVWLGVRSGDSDLALGFIRAVGRPGKVGGVGVVRGLQAVMRLLGRPYWKRLWIIQEVAVASRIRIQCGTAHTKWKHFCKFRKVFAFADSPFCLKEMYKLDMKELQDHMTILFLHEMRDKYQAGRARLCMLLEMSDLAQSQCSDVRDKVYGLVGLANDAADLVIDYSKTPFDLFVDLFLHGLKHDIRDNWIGYARFLQRILLGEVKTPPIDSPYSSRISVVAKVYETGTISYLGPNLDWNRVEFKHNYTPKLVEAMKLEACNPSVVIPISSNIAYAVKESKASPVTAKTDNGTSKVLRTKRPFDYVGSINSMDATTFIGAEYVTSILKESEPLIFADERGHIGIAPSNTRVSDTICRMEGGLPNISVVVILRKIDARYIVVGRAMFPDIEGEGLSEREEDRINFHLDIRTLQLLTNWQAESTQTALDW